MDYRVNTTEEAKDYIPYVKVKNETLANKVVAFMLLIIGWLPVFIFKDATALVFLAMIAIPLFFEKENVIDIFE